jgi:ketosteroid isomerase-like protein
MALSTQYVQQVFGTLQQHADDFFKHVADNVSWTVMGTHPLAGTYHNKEDFLNHTFRRLKKNLKGNLSLQITHVYTDGDTAIVEMHTAATAKNGKPFINTYCWVTRFSNQKIVKVRAYVDSVAVSELILNNE